MEISKKPTKETVTDESKPKTRVEARKRDKKRDVSESPHNEGPEEGVEESEEAKDEGVKTYSKRSWKAPERYEETPEQKWEKEISRAKTQLCVLEEIKEGLDERIEKDIDI